MTPAAASPPTSGPTPTPPPRPPGPRQRWFGIPLLRDMARDYLGFVQRLQQAHGDVVYMRLGREQTYDVFDPELAREVLQDTNGSFVRWERVVEVFAESQGQGLLVVEGAAWQRQRRLLQPGFQGARMQGYGRLMVAATARRLEAIGLGLRQAEGAGDTGQEVDFEHEMTHVTMDVILRTLFSSAADDEALAAEEAVQVLSRMARREVFLPATLPDWLPLPGKAAKRWALRTLEALVRRHIDQRVQHMARPRAADGAAAASEPDLLDMLLSVRDEQGQGLPAQEIRDQCMTIFQAGHETTATALTWWGHTIATHPAAAARAAAEVDEAMAGRPPTLDDLPALRYLGATLKEAMRLYPPIAAVMGRRAVREVQLGPWRLPARALVRITPWVIHHDARWFEQPEAFLPERFLQTPVPWPRGAYLPFGAGPRVCVGQHFATAEMTLIAAMLLQRFSLRPVAGAAPPQLELNVTLRPKHGLRLRLVPRTMAHAV